MEQTGFTHLEHWMDLKKVSIFYVFASASKCIKASR